MFVLYVDIVGRTCTYGAYACEASTLLRQLITC